MEEIRWIGVKTPLQARNSKLIKARRIGQNLSRKGLRQTRIKFQLRKKQTF